MRPISVVRFCCVSIAALALAVPSSPAMPAVSFRFTPASDVHQGKPIPPRFTCDGRDVSPRLVWRGVPKRTKELALVLDDPDAPGGTFTHWIVWGLTPEARAFGGASPLVGRAPREGRNDFGKVGYGGPCPPRGQTHHYVFQLLALGARVLLRAGADRAEFDRAVVGHVLAQARLVATYTRQ